MWWFSRGLGRTILEPICTPVAMTYATLRDQERDQGSPMKEIIKKASDRSFKKHNVFDELILVFGWLVL